MLLGCRIKPHLRPASKAFNLAHMQLDFRLFDDITQAWLRGKINASYQKNFVADSLGPLVEWAQLCAEGTLPLPTKVDFLSIKSLRPLVVALTSNPSRPFGYNASSEGLIKFENVNQNDSRWWTSISLQVQSAADHVGFSRVVANRMVAAIVEMNSNIWEHSGRPSTGFIAYKVMQRNFEFVVGDRGIGVLESLRSCQTYSSVCDYGEALQLATSDGVSRFGPGCQRGYGFHSILVGLANHRGLIRYRSGDYSLTIDGTKDESRPTLIAKRPFLSGLLVSVECAI